MIKHCEAVYCHCTCETSLTVDDNVVVVVVAMVAVPCLVALCVAPKCSAPRPNHETPPVLPGSTGLLGFPTGSW